MQSVTINHSSQGFYDDSRMSSTSVSPSPPHQQLQPQHHQTGASRRPPRKSTLTQQQKNQKRQRATQDQLVTLEAEFNKNPTPTAIVRERIAQTINMTERSVQIWFQNRRAKIKLMAKKSLETGEDCDAIPESMRQYLAMTESGKGLPHGLMGDRSMGYGNMFMAPEPASSGKIVIQHFQCRSLSIGSWRRHGQNAMDLVIFYSPEKACMTYYINNDSAGYKIEYPFSSIKSIELETLDSPTSANGVNKQGQLVVTLNRPPNFYMDSSGQGGFYQCMDFTEKQQASEILVHYLGGHAKTLSGQLAKLMTLDVFMNRHNIAQPQPMIPPPLNFYDQPTFAISAPVSPQIVRPASSNDIAPPMLNVPRDATHPHFRGHKRQRSRSVPIAVNFAALHQGIPQHQFSFQDAHDQLFAPVPQHLGNNLRIDTSHSDFLDYRPAYPLSAATTTSPSDYASPNLISNNGQMHNDMTATNANFGSPYNMPWLSPMADAQSMMGASTSPLSMHGDPHIASPSPPLGTVRDASVDLQMLPEHNLHEESMLSELYSKQSLSMVGSPGFDDCDGVDFMEQLSLSHMVSQDQM